MNKNLFSQHTREAVSVVSFLRVSLSFLSMIRKEKSKVKIEWVHESTECMRIHKWIEKLAEERERDRMTERTGQDTYMYRQRSLVRGSGEIEKKEELKYEGQSFYRYLQSNRLVDSCKLILCPTSKFDWFKRINFLQFSAHNCTSAIKNKA